MNTHQQCQHPISPLLKPEWLEQLTSTPFLTQCQQGTISRAALHLFVKQHQLYSRRFTRYLAALLSTLDDNEDRFELTQNLFDEMGLGEPNAVSHPALYQNMMTKMSISSDEIAFPATQKLIDTMWQCCRAENYQVGLGALCLGAEALVPHLYSIIVNGFLATGEPLENLEFFTLHIHCDEQHSDTLCKIIDKELRKNPAAIIDLEYGAVKMIQARIDFFNGLLL